MVIEIDKRFLKEDYNNNIKKCVVAGDFLEWTPEKIKSAFNFNNGTIKDLKRYMRDNKCYCLFLDSDTLQPIKL